MYPAKGQGKNRWVICPAGLPGAGKNFRAG